MLEGLDERFGKANKVMGWLSDCARAISKADEPVKWTTRLGLPVVQPYKHQVSTKNLQTPMTLLAAVKFSIQGTNRATHSCYLLL